MGHLSSFLAKNSPVRYLEIHTRLTIRKLCSDDRVSYQATVKYIEFRKKILLGDGMGVLAQLSIRDGIIIYLGIYWSIFLNILDGDKVTESSKCETNKLLT